jgi:hypothetical protein
MECLKSAQGTLVSKTLVYLVRKLKHGEALSLYLEIDRASSNIY